MGKRKDVPVMSQEAYETKLINMSMKAAEEQISSGTASSQVITHFLRLGTEKARWEREKLKAEVELARARAQNIESQRNSEELLERAISAFRSYTSTDEDYRDEELY